MPTPSPAPSSAASKRTRRAGRLKHCSAEAGDRVDQHGECGVGVDRCEDVAVRWRALAQRALVDHGHPTRQRAARLDANVALPTLEQRRVGQSEHGERIVDRGPGDVVVEGPGR